MTEDKNFVEEVSALLYRYRVVPAPENPVIFYGSSNFSRWKYIDADMAPFVCLDHAFGGSRDDDLLRWYKKLVVRFSPYAVVVNSSQNDVIAYDDGRIIENKRLLLTALKSDLPKSRIVLLSVIRSAPFRTKRVDALDKSVKRLCAETGAEFVDISHLFDDGCFCDTSHLNRDGQQRLADVIKTVLNSMDTEENK